MKKIIIAFLIFAPIIKADERPTRFEHEGQAHVICDIINQTREEIVGKGLQNRFTVKTKEGKIYTLSHEEIKDKWFLEE